ncbi:MAG: helix-turn-helix transcriptional regulator [Bacteroidetes bacterium]|jgi:DNA-binding HxlR family transcriptional regulator|nr:helix-turn-helix transcriptional regulator [Bacteroidota bacterium]
MKEKSPAYAELIQNYTRFDTCPVTATLAVIGGKWKPIILYLISHDVNRFGELLKMVDGISKKVLTAQLRELERDGILHRKVYAEIPPRVEYSITAKGLTLRPILIAMREWGLENLEGLAR